jgi:hypothetical protein
MLLSSISGAQRAVPGVSALGLPFESQRKTQPHVPAHSTNGLMQDISRKEQKSLAAKRTSRDHERGGAPSP